MRLQKKRLRDYTEEELLEIAEAAIRVRFHLHVDATGNLRVAGYHVNDSTGYKDRVPVWYCASETTKARRYKPYQRYNRQPDGR